MNWVRHLCEGLKMIHHGGLVHRYAWVLAMCTSIDRGLHSRSTHAFDARTNSDIKLENVFLDSCGNALIGDFGLATASAQPPVCARASIEATPIGSERTLSLSQMPKSAATAHIEVVGSAGTAAYNAPELWAPLVKYDCIVLYCIDA